MNEQERTIEALKETIHLMQSTIKHSYQDAEAGVKTADNMSDAMYQIGRKDCASELMSIFNIKE